ncbi:hypothetical protein EYC80_002459 [Monilinia laxa]|uniref:Uncharacterized protein n=1 Tax=Monilinia laxa TaxID=61186 RepID=A0A5N6K450_MONLA|nr:hypothetical protein EYC80_002459 [Monilinia laxa]
MVRSIGWWRKWCSGFYACKLVSLKLQMLNIYLPSLEDSYDRFVLATDTTIAAATMSTYKVPVPYVSTKTPRQCFRIYHSSHLLNCIITVYPYGGCQSGSFSNPDKKTPAQEYPIATVPGHDSLTSIEL